MKTILFAVGILLLTTSVSAKNNNAVNFEKLADAIYMAEGGSKTSHPYGILSVKVKSKEDARRTCLNTIRNNYIRWHKNGSKGEFLLALQNVYAPIKAGNDPTGLNKNWYKNVKYYYTENIRWKIKLHS